MTVRSFLAWWVLANAVGWSIGGVGSLMMGTSFAEAWPLSPSIDGRRHFVFDTFALEVWGFAAAVGAVIGVCAGGLQWMALRETRHPLGQWSLATAAGAGVGVPAGILGATLMRLPFPPWSDIVAWTIFGIFLGAFVGLAQRPVLRRRAARVDRWLLTNALGGGAGALAASLTARLGSAVGLFRMREDLLASVAFASVAGAVGGIITGPLLARLLQLAAMRGAAGEGRPHRLHRN